jgi:hypothetical protein
MQKGTNPGRMDWILSFHYPTKGKDAIGDTTSTWTAVGNKTRAERIQTGRLNESTEKIEASQQVGSSVLAFRLMDLRSKYSITQEWQFDAYPISNVSLSKRFKVLGIEDEGRRNYIIITGEYRDNG